MKINSVDRAIRILELLSEYPRGLKLTEISKILDIHPSSLHHIIHTLSPYDYIAQDSDTKRYSLGLRLLTISSRLLESIDIRKIARVHLEELKNKCQQTIHLAILKEDKVVYIDKLDATGTLSLATYIGFSTDAYAAAGGKVLLSGLSDEKVKSLYHGKTFKKYGKNTIHKLSNLLVELDAIRGRGYALDDEEYYEGVRCVAAPITSGNKIVASTSITGSKFAITIERIERELKYMIIEYAEKISAELRW
jgi:DNA-binding IclR family transcriptional regulator